MRARLGILEQLVDEVRSIAVPVGEQQVPDPTDVSSVSTLVFPAYRRKLSRGKLLGFLASQPGCTVAMEACASAHYWGREIAVLGHEVRLVPPIYVKPFVKRQKNDTADAEAIAEAA